MKNSEHPTLRFIRGQGDLDGACLLYALFNARQALTSTRLTQTAWSNALEELHNANAFLDSTRGSEETDSDSEAERMLAETFINALAPEVKLQVRTLKNMRNGSLGKMSPDQNSVIVCSNPQHWFCIVESNDTNAFVACSWVWQRDLNTYFERVSPELDRVFNEVLSLEDLEFFNARALMVCLS